MCIRDSTCTVQHAHVVQHDALIRELERFVREAVDGTGLDPVSYTHLRAHETVLDLVCRLLLEKKTI